MSALWSVEYQRKDSDTKDCLWVRFAEPKSMARADLKAARVNAQRLARARLAPPGFVVPCQPLLVARPPSGPGWLHEIKHDGYRILARKEGTRVTLWSRYGTNFTDRLPRIVEAVRSLPAESALIDGEAVAFRLDGHSDFATLRTKAGGAMACLVAFDLINLDGEGLRQRRIEGRRDALSRLVRGVDGILFSEAFEAEGAIVFHKACEMGLEGIVSKRAGSRYWSGNSRYWLKSKNPAFLRE